MVGTVRAEGGDKVLAENPRDFLTPQTAFGLLIPRYHIQQPFYPGGDIRSTNNNGNSVDPCISVYPVLSGNVSYNNTTRTKTSPGIRT